MKLKTRPYDAVEYLRDETDMAGLLNAALEDGHPGVVALTIGDVARALGMTDVARRAGLGRESLYKALSANGNPEFATVLKVIQALGFRLTVKPAKTTRAARASSKSLRKKAAPKPKRTAARQVTARARPTA